MIKIIILLLISCTAFGQSGTGLVAYAPIDAGLVLTLPIQTGIVPKVTVVNNVAMLSFTASNVGSFQWVITPAASASIIYGGSDMASKTVSLKSGIKYTFTLTVWDRYGNPPQTSTVVYDNSVPLVPVPKKDTAYQITLFDANGKRFTTINVFKDTSISKQ